MPSSQNNAKTGSAAQEPKQSGNQSGNQNGQASKPATSSSTNNSSGGSETKDNKGKSKMTGPGDQIYEHIRNQMFQ